VESVIFCGQLGPQPTGHAFKATSLPGHLIHIVTHGRVQQECNGREYFLRPGTVIWYHEDELVRGRVVDGPWIWYSVSFIAPTLPPPGYTQREFFPPLRKVVRPFISMLSAWQNHSLPPLLRTIQVHAALLEILQVLGGIQENSGEAAAPSSSPAFGKLDPRARLWWELETKLRRTLEQKIDLALMEKLSGRSAATIARSCLFAVGVPPLKRIKQVRMSLARGLVQRSELSISQIATQIGYGRVHEFSRDYHKHFGIPPTAHRGQRS
jgi:AraC-like DNA-binding protein